MGTVSVDPNAKLTRQRINLNGEVIDPRTKQVIQRVVEEPMVQTPPPQPEPVVETKTPQTPQTDAVAEPSPIVSAIKAQVQEAVKDSLKGIDLKGMINAAIQEALK